MTKSAKTLKEPEKSAESTKPSSTPKSYETGSTELTGPTLLTIARMILSVVFMILVMIPNILTHIFAFILFVAGAISDLIDGKWARKHQKVTDLGAFLDPLADKTLINLAFLALVAMDIVPVWVFAVILIRDFAVDGMRMMIARDGITIAASFYGKLKTTFQLTAIIILLFNLIANWQWLGIIGNIALYLALILTIFSGADYLIKSWPKIIKKQK